MDALRFDALVRSLAGSPTRRTRIDRIRAWVAPIPRAPGPAESTVCPTDRVECDGLCASAWMFEHDAKNCGACGQTCPHGEVCCDGRCRDLTSDAMHCGACGAACAGGEYCRDGACL